MPTLEICCYDIESAIIAQDGGADRIELCSGRYDGGLTPSYGALIKTHKFVSVPVYPIVRPRGGDFYYSQSEIATMKSDISLIKELGFKGIVLGALETDGSIDILIMRKLLALTSDLSVTFHRAFDMCKDPMTALKQLADLGIDRVLTSGQQPTAEQGLPLIIELNEKTTGPKIMAGSGINASNIQTFLDAGLTDIHSSAGKYQPSYMQYHNPNISMSQKAPQDEYLNYQVDADVVVAMKEQVRPYQ